MVTRSAHSDTVRDPVRVRPAHFSGAVPLFVGDAPCWNTPSPWGRSPAGDPRHRAGRSEVVKVDIAQPMGDRDDWDV